MTELPTPPSQTPEKTSVFPDAKLVCYWMIAFTGYQFATKPTNTTGQLIFRLVLLGGVVGLLLIWLRRKKA